MFKATHTFHGIPVRVLSKNDDGTIRVQSRNSLNDRNMGPEVLNPPMTVLSAEWLVEVSE